MGFSVKIQEMGGDRIKISDDVIDDWRKEGALACIETTNADQSEEPCFILNRDHLVALRSAIDMILTADDARQSPPGTSPSTT